MDPFSFVITNAAAVAVVLGALSVVCTGLVAWELRRKQAPAPLLALSLIAPVSFLVTVGLMFAFGEKSR